MLLSSCVAKWYVVASDYWVVVMVLLSGIRHSTRAVKVHHLLAISNGFLQCIFWKHKTAITNWSKTLFWCRGSSWFHQYTWSCKRSDKKNWQVAHWNPQLLCKVHIKTHSTHSMQFKQINHSCNSEKSMTLIFWPKCAWERLLVVWSFSHMCILLINS